MTSRRLQQPLRRPRSSRDDDGEISRKEDRSSLRLYPLKDFIISGVEPAISTTRKFIQLIILADTV
jgi:hypothetical protein